MNTKQNNFMTKIVFLTKSGFNCCVTVLKFSGLKSSAVSSDCDEADGLNKERLDNCLIIEI